MMDDDNDAYCSDLCVAFSIAVRSYRRLQRRRSFHLLCAHTHTQSSLNQLNIILRRLVYILKLINWSLPIVNCACCGHQCHATKNRYKINGSHSSETFFSFHPLATSDRFFFFFALFLSFIVYTLSMQSTSVSIENRRPVADFAPRAHVYICVFNEHRRTEAKCQPI